VVLEVFRFSPSDGCPVTAPCLASTQAMRSRRVSSTSKIPDCVVAHGQTCAPHRSDRYPPVRPVRSCCNSVFGSSALALWIKQGAQWFSSEPPETPRTQCSLRQSPLMTRLPRSPGSTLVLRLNQETVHDFILLFHATMRPALDPAGHQVPRTKRNCLLHTWRPHRRRPFVLVLHLHQYQSSRNLHLQYLSKN
jgi:hypothetical protein